MAACKRTFVEPEWPNLNSLPQVARFDSVKTDM